LDYSDEEEGVQDKNDAPKTNYGQYKLFKGDGTLTRFNQPSIVTNTTYDQIIGNYYVEGSSVSNIIIKGGRVKQLTIDGNIIDV